MTLATIEDFDALMERTRNERIQNEAKKDWARRKSNKVSEKSREKFAALADIGELPAVVDPARKEACRYDLPLFLKEYFPFSTGLSPLGDDQIKAIKRIQVAIQEEGWVANVMPRGFTKSTISENAILWAMLYGWEKYILFFAGTASLAEKGVLSIKRELLTNDLLLEDFPEACYPLQCLEGKFVRALTQTYQGELTNCIASKDVLRLACIPGADSSGAIIESYGLLAPPRGTRYKDEQGRNVRPGLAILDDPQTDDALPLDTPILTAEGWKTMGALRVHDRVFGPDGELTYVVATSPIKTKPCYKLTFDDGSELIASDTHKWVTQTTLQRTNARRRSLAPQRSGPQYERKELSSVRTTKELFETQSVLDRGKLRSNHSIDATLPLQLPDKLLGVDPYVLGVWLGNGTSRDGTITINDLDSADVCGAIINAGLNICLIARQLYQGRPANAALYLVDGLKEQLINIDVRHNKHIPDDYFLGSESQRLALVQGLMDSDGHCDTRGRCVFSNTNPDLIEGMLLLLRSLGMKPTSIKQLPTKLSTKDCWKVEFRATMPVFHSSRKLSRLPTVEPRPDVRRRFIVRVEEVEPQPVRCIEVESLTHLYLAGKELIPTHNSARSLTQTEARIGYITNSISMAGGHGNEMSLILNGTIIKNGDLVDQLSNYDLHPEWQSVRIAMVKKMPIALESHWLGEYARLRRTYDRDDERGRIKAKEAATAYLKDHYDEMHTGAEVSWEHIQLEKTEISALQHAINIYIDKGPETFSSECQNAPLRALSVTGQEITDATAERFGECTRRIVPVGKNTLVAHIDVHDNILYYSVAAVANDFTGSLIDYGTFPDQRTQIFSQRTAKYTIQNYYKLYSEDDTEACIALAVEDLLHELNNYPWQDADGNPYQLTCILVDGGYKPEAVRSAIRKSGLKNVIMSRGLPTNAKKKPLQEYNLEPEAVIKFGPDKSNVRWLLPVKEKVGGVYTIQFDANYWKSCMLARMTQTTPMARWDLFRGYDHSFLIHHLMSEQPELDIGDGRTVMVFKPTVSGHSVENHWLDTTTGTMVAASLCGCHLPVATEVSRPVPVPPRSNARVDYAPTIGDNDGFDRPYLIGARD